MHILLLLSLPVLANDEALIGTHTLEFTPDLVFGGNSDDENFIWPLGSVGVSADKAGNIYLCDPPENRILVFDKAGKYLRTMGSEGEGPGEFEALLTFRILNDGRGVAVEGELGFTRLHYFNADGSFSHMENTSLTTQSITLSPTGEYFGAFYYEKDPVKPVSYWLSGLFDSKGKLLKQTSKISAEPADRSKHGDPAYWVGRLANNLGRMNQGYGVFNYDREGNVYIAHTAKYEVVKWRRDLSAQMQTYSREYKPFPRTQEEIDLLTEEAVEAVATSPSLSGIITRRVFEKAYAKADLPLAKNPIYAILVMEDNTLLVVHDRDLVKKTELADIYAPDGTFLGQVRMTGNVFVTLLNEFFLPRMVFENGYAYTIRRNQNDDNQVVRYTYKLVKN